MISTKKSPMARTFGRAELKQLEALARARRFRRNIATAVGLVVLYVVAACLVRYCGGAA